MEFTIQLIFADLLLVLGMIGVATLAAFGLRAGWMKRILVSFYIALAIILVMPEELFFSSYADVYYFIGMTLLITFLGHGRLFGTEGGWGGGRIPWKTIIFGFLIVGFLLSIIVSFLPAADTKDIVSSGLRSLFRDNLCLFVWSLAPVLFVLIFDRR